MSILQMSLSIPTRPHNLSSFSIISGPTHLFLTPKLSHLTLHTKTTPIRMGGGPRTFPGGVSKWQWKRMQAKKSKQLLKARLARERQIYEMRKRAELKAAVTELERPWESVAERAPRLFSASADEQVKVLADRFQKSGGFDMWSEKDGPQLFTPVDGLPSTRFFPKGVVHSTKPYGNKIIEKKDLCLPGSVSGQPENGVKRNGYDGFKAKSENNLCLRGSVSETETDGVKRNGYYSNTGRFGDRFKAKGSSGKFRKDSSDVVVNNLSENGKKRNGYMNSGRIGDRLRSEGPKNCIESSVDRNNGKFRKKEKKRSFGVENLDNLNGEQRRETPSRGNGGNGRSRGSGWQKLRGRTSEICDMSLQNDGSYGFLADN